jgi:hypothetical protein
MFKFSKTKASVIFGAFILCVLIYSDLSPYQKARHDMLKSMPVAKVEAITKLIGDDVDRISLCIRKHREGIDTNEPTQAAAFRACILDTLPKIKTPTGAIAMAKVASEWLTTHPDDDAVRTSAIATIQNGREELLEQKSWYYDSLDKVSKAQNHSIILRHIKGNQDVSSLYGVLAKGLEQAEKSLR